MYASQERWGDAAVLQGKLVEAMKVDAPPDKEHAT
jgi:hypothetical protein